MLKRVWLVAVSLILFAAANASAQSNTSVKISSDAAQICVTESIPPGADQNVKARQAAGNSQQNRERPAIETNFRG